MTNIPTPDICIYHKGCTDGFTAAWAVWSRWNDGIQFFGGRYGDEPLNVEGKHLLFVDFTYKQPVMRELAAKASSITVFDHHKTALADLQPLFDEKIIIGVFDMDRSGAGIAWDELHPGKTRPKLVSYVEDRDLWRWKLADSREISSYLNTVPMEDFLFWTFIANNLEVPEVYRDIVRQGGAVNRKMEIDCKSLVKRARWLDIGGVRAPVVNASMQYSSDLGNALAKLEGAPFGVVYHIDENGDSLFSLRSLPDNSGMDVGEIALKYGGGGHRNASGFMIRAGQRL